MEPLASDQSKIWDHFQNEGVDSFSLNHGRLEFLAKKISPGARALNIGVGNGALERKAASCGVDIWSLDPSERAIETLRETLSLGERAQVGFSQAMPFPDCHFDVVVMSEVLEHLDDGVYLATLAEVKRVLKNGGSFIGTVPARENLQDSLVVCPHCGNQFHRWGHVRSFNIDALATSLGSYFQVVEAREYFFIEWESVGWWCKLQGLIKKFLSWRGIGTYGVCRNIYFSVIKAAR